MIVVTTPGITDSELDGLIEHVERAGLRTHVSRGEHRTIVGCVGDTASLEEAGLTSLPGVEQVMRVLKPYKLASREFSVAATHVPVGDAVGTVFGGREIVVIAGPCSVEGRDMLHESARAVKASGARLLRGGAFKPRSSPYAFQGLGEVGLQMLADVRAETGLPIVTEVMDPRQVELVASYADVLQIGARNMQNFLLLAEVGRLDKPVLLKRGASATIEELLMAAEYVVKEGNGNVILCERGIRTFETATRNTLDISAVPVCKLASHLPIVIDPSHATGRLDLVLPLSLTAVVAGADGVIVETHPNPEHALCDGPQSLPTEAFAEYAGRVGDLVAWVGKTVS
jgi:3-deoxy-7-phosphoheptulonate synthase